MLSTKGETRKGDFMALKGTEPFVRDCLIEYLGLTANDIEEVPAGQDPPDIYINYNNQRIAVEITEIVPDNRLTRFYWSKRLIDEINSMVKDKLPEGVDLSIFWDVPVENPNKFKKELKSWIGGFIKSDLKIGDSTTIDIDGNEILIGVRKGDDNLEERVFSGIVDKEIETNLKIYAENELKRIIESKTDKCKDVQHSGPFWLALYYEALGTAFQNPFPQAMKSITMQHIFDEIYVVSSGKEVDEIYP